MGIHDAYGKEVLKKATNGQFRHWFVRGDLTVNYPPGGMTAELDGVIGKDCVVEVEGVNEKQIRGGILDLVFHPHPKKLLVIIPANINNKPENIERACQRLLDDLIMALYPVASGQVIVLSGTGHNKSEFLKQDCAKVQEALRFLDIK